MKRGTLLLGWRSTRLKLEFYSSKKALEAAIMDADRRRASGTSRNEQQGRDPERGPGKRHLRRAANGIAPLHGGCCLRYSTLDRETMTRSSGKDRLSRTTRGERRTDVVTDD